jgi:(p)ppGpp synthase/HD superfamily hydrolase
MSQNTTTPKLGERFSHALTFAADKHRTQVRKGGDIPYLGHLLSVAGLVIEAGGDETEAIAALLHDAAEDAGGEATLAEIRDIFGEAPAAIVAECSDTFETPKPPWKDRKRSYIEHVATATDSAVLVSLADKLDNARGMLRDHRALGDALWQRFSVQDPREHLWYYTSLLAVFRQRRPGCWMVEELGRVIEELGARVTAA